MEPKELDDKRLKDVLPPVEDSGINSRAVLIFCGALIVTAIIVHVLIWYVFNIFDARQKSADPTLSPLTPKQQQLPPEPRLQAMPNESEAQKQQLFEPMGVLQVQENEKQLLDSYGWIDQQNGVARIKIEDAMKLIVERQSQTQTAPATQTSTAENVQQ